VRRDPLYDPEPLIRQVYAYVAYRIGAGADAEDVTSETFERALRYRGSFDPGKGTPIVWLCGIARRALAGRFGQAELALDDEQEDVAGGFEQQAAARLDLKEALACLSKRERELISLRYGADLSSKEIGLLLGLEPGTVDVSLHRAKARLRLLLEETVAS
jgi:RNA polymerase sigma-70 factor (ECF subfamily)